MYTNAERLEELTEENALSIYTTSCELLRQLCCRPAWQARNKHSAISWISPNSTHQALWPFEDRAPDGLLHPSHFIQRLASKALLSTVLPGRPETSTVQCLTSPPTAPVKPCGPQKKPLLIAPRMAHKGISTQ